jgi:hypothetical protein
MTIDWPNMVFSTMLKQWDVLRRADSFKFMRFVPQPDLFGYPVY